MKRLLAIILTGAMLIAFAGCGADKAAENAASIDVEGLYKSVSSMTTEPLVSLDDTYISNYYGIDTSLLDGYVFAQSENPKSAETVIMFKCSDETKLNEYVTAVETAVEQKTEELNNYDLPDQAKLASDSKVETVGNFVYVVISSNADAINADVLSALNNEL